eukprot:GHVU01111729.1.p1 GENE.GHVU01111729.1~~GHVU01111729.1.p1  ORF type:complete len:139 (+),score=16.92 GHVU01111729.1:1026-1442(+)
MEDRRAGQSEFLIGGVMIPCFGCFDSGSTHNLISEEIVDRLRAAGEAVVITELPESLWMRMNTTESEWITKTITLEVSVHNPETFAEGGLIRGLGAVSFLISERNLTTQLILGGRASQDVAVASAPREYFATVDIKDQ